MKRLRAWICSKTGHWFSTRELLVFGIKTNERNRDMTATILCRCCGRVFVHEDAVSP